MTQLVFNTAEKLRAFYLEQGFFAIYDCSVESGEKEVHHYALLKPNEGISPGCHGLSILELNDDNALHIINEFLKTGNVQIHPKAFTL